MVQSSDNKTLLRLRHGNEKEVSDALALPMSQRTREKVLLIDHSLYAMVKQKADNKSELCKGNMRMLGNLYTDFRQ